MDQPSFDGLNTFLVSKETSKHTKVSLSGIGADEIFFGYEIINNFINAKKTNMTFDSFFAFLYKLRPNRFLKRSFYNKIKIQDFFLNLRKINFNRIDEIFENDFITDDHNLKMNSDILKVDNHSKIYIREFLILKLKTI